MLTIIIITLLIVILFWMGRFYYLHQNSQDQIIQGLASIDSHLEKLIKIQEEKKKNDSK